MRFSRSGTPFVYLVASFNGAERLDMHVCCLCVARQVSLLVECRATLLAHVLPQLQVHTLHVPRMLNAGLENKHRSPDPGDVKGTVSLILKAWKCGNGIRTTKIPVLLAH